MAERRQAVRAGGVVTAAYVDGRSMRQVAGRLSARGYDVLETPHFVVCHRARGRNRTVLMHTFDEATIDEDVSNVVAEELGPLGVLTSAAEYGDALFSIVASTCPPALDCPRCGGLHLDQPAIWRHFCLNTLERLRPLVAGRVPARPARSHVEQFAAVYRRIMEHRAGDTVLDVGSNLGLLPVLLSERTPDLTVVGCDNRPDAITVAADLATATGRDRVRFELGDVLAPGFARIGRFDTVIAVHLLEHLAEEQVPIALTNMLGAAARRLIVSVPYEEPMQPLYGHVQAFTPAKVRAWGKWCVDTLGGGRSWCEEVCGGMLVVDLPLCS
jgi:SAM-dependent methyltransferase